MGLSDLSAYKNKYRSFRNKESILIIHSFLHKHRVIEPILHSMPFLQEIFQGEKKKLKEPG